MKLHSFSLLALGLFALLVTPTSSVYAAIISATDTFTGITAVPSEYRVFNTGMDGDGDPNQLLMPAASNVTDGNDLGDGVNDGLLEIGRNPDTAGGQSVGTIRTIGTVMAGDVGSTVEIDVAYESITAAGFNPTYSILVAGGAEDSVSTGFGANDGVLSINASVLSYVIDSGDVGDVLEFQVSYFASSNNSRRLGLDTVKITVTPVPEPVTLLLSAFAAVSTLTVRRRR